MPQEPNYRQEFVSARKSGKNQEKLKPFTNPYLKNLNGLEQGQNDPNVYIPQSIMIATVPLNKAIRNNSQELEFALPLTPGRDIPKISFNVTSMSLEDDEEYFNLSETQKDLSNVSSLSTDEEDDILKISEISEELMSP